MTWASRRSPRRSATCFPIGVVIVLATFAGDGQVGVIAWPGSVPRFDDKQRAVQRKVRSSAGATLSTRGHRLRPRTVRAPLSTMRLISAPATGPPSARRCTVSTLRGREEVSTGPRSVKRYSPRTGRGWGSEARPGASPVPTTSTSTARCRRLSAWSDPARPRTSR